jgi:hypothetical protein
MEFTLAATVGSGVELLLTRYNGVDAMLLRRCRRSCDNRVATRIPAHGLMTCAGVSGDFNRVRRHEVKTKLADLSRVFADKVFSGDSSPKWPPSMWASIPAPPKASLRRTDLDERGIRDEHLGLGKAQGMWSELLRPECILSNGLGEVKMVREATAELTVRG